MRFADRLHRAFFNDGALTPSNAAARYASRAAQVETAVYSEVARWGAYRREVTPGGTIPRYGTNEWAAERNRLLTAYFPVRTGIVLEQFRATNLYAAVAAPEFSQHGGTLEFGALLGVVSTQGMAYVTFDGSDPRVAFTGEVASNAAANAGPFAVTNAGVVLRTDVELAVQHLAGNPDYGALRRREAWSGPGGLRKTGPGVAALNGEGKTFTGPVLIDEGVLIVTGPAAPAQAAGRGRAAERPGAGGPGARRAGPDPPLSAGCG